MHRRWRTLRGNSTLFGFLVVLAFALRFEWAVTAFIHLPFHPLSYVLVPPPLSASSEASTPAV